MDRSLLNEINTPADLRRLPLSDLPRVCQEIRDYLISELSGNPGHFASSLGVVELTVALHYVFDTPYDRIVWDVGHQAYAHKILTGRREAFATNRKFHGLRPFPSPEESEYDACTAGHASNSISMALGMALAAKAHDEHRHVVAVIGDGSLSGGLAYEGLNNAANIPNDALFILNDNNMSIDRSVGGMKDVLHRLQTSYTYNRWRYVLARRLISMGWLNEKRRKAIIRFNNSLKSMITHQQNIFEGLDIRYFGPADGHDVIELVHTLRAIQDMKGPKLLHIHTVKGKGYEPAEQGDPVWHAPGCFDVKTGERIHADEAMLQPRFQDVFGRTLVTLARANPAIVGVTPAMPTGCSLTYMMDEMPDRAFDVGIAEGHAVTFSAGMARDGLIPFCNIYSSFAQRAYDNIIHDVAISHLHVVLCLDRAGLVGEDGPTHHGAFDLAYLRPIPGLTIASPVDADELRGLMALAQEPDQGPFVIRYPRGRVPAPIAAVEDAPMQVGRGRCLKHGTDTAILTLGPLAVQALEAIRQVEASDPSRDIALYDMRFLKPLDEDILRKVSHMSHIVTVEDGVRVGGLGSAVTEWLTEHGATDVRITRLGLPDHFVEHGSPAELYHLVGLDAEGIARALTSNITTP